MRISTVLRRAAVIAITAAALFVLRVAAADAADYVVIEVMHRPAGEIVGAIKAVLSPNGTVIADERNNTLIIMDDSTVLKKAEELVRTLDVPARHVRLHVTLFEAQDRHKVDLSVRWRYNGGGFSIGNVEHPRGGEGLTAATLPGAITSSVTSVTNQDLLVESGASGRFVTGAEVPVGDAVIARLRRDGVIREGVVFREASTGFVFTPTILGGEVHLDITPFLSYFLDEKEGSIVFYDAGTKVSIPEGQTVVIAENETEQGRLVGDIFSGFSKSVTTGRFYIAVTPEIED